MKYIKYTIYVPVDNLRILYEVFSNKTKDYLCVGLRHYEF